MQQDKTTIDISKRTKGLYFENNNGYAIWLDKPNDFPDKNRMIVCSVYTNKPDEWATKICKACNNYDKLVEALQGFIDNAIIDKKIAENQLIYYKGQFRKLLQSIEQDI